MQFQFKFIYEFLLNFVRNETQNQNRDPSSNFVLFPPKLSVPISLSEVVKNIRTLFSHSRRFSKKNASTLDMSREEEGSVETEVKNTKSYDAHQG